MNASIFITTTIPYVNSYPHVGHAQEFVIADCIARLFRQVGHEVRFQTGTDENASKNIIAAKKAGVSPQRFIDRNAAVFRDLVASLNVSTDTFLRTTEPRHRKGVELFWSRLDPADLYSQSYVGSYCVGCEDFLLEKDLSDGVCPDHRTAPETVEEKNIFFKLSRYQERLEALIESDVIRILPISRKNEALQFIRQGLQDISVTRRQDRSEGWGIAVPGNPDQIIYVWIDALINYLSGQGFGEDDRWTKIWNEQTRKIHVIGKNVWKFHAIYWPALLLSAGLPVPNEVLVHGFLTNDGTKISKSLGNSVDPFEVIEDHGSDAVRHYLLSRVPIFTDSDFSTERLSQIYTADLANRLGNLYSRLRVLCEKAGFDRWSHSSGERVRRSLPTYDLAAIARPAWDEIDRLNAEINERRPWELLKERDGELLHDLLFQWIERLRRAVVSLEPYLPEASEKILRGLSSGEGDRILFPPRKR